MITKTPKSAMYLFKSSTIGSITNPLIKYTKSNKNGRVDDRPSLLTMRLCFNFVNIPISSKYYQTRLPTSLEPAFKLAEKQQKLNQKGYLLQYIAELVTNDPKLMGRHVQNFMIKELNKWKGSTGGRFQRVATIAWIIRKMGIRKQLNDLYQEIVGRIDDDEWYVDFDQSVKAIQAFSNYEDREMRDKLFEKIERNLGISLTDVNMTYYQRICASLFQAERFRSPIWEKIQGFVTRNLSMDYTAKTFFDIFKYFAITRNGTSQFYQICQEVIHRGHVYNKNFTLRSTSNDFDATGDYFAMMIETYAIVNKYTPFPLSPDFLDHVYKSMLSSKLEYRDISALTKIIKNMGQIEFYEEEIDKVVFDIIKNKEFTTYQSLTDIQSLYFSLEERYKKVPEKLMSNVEALIRKDLNRHLLPLQTAIETTQFLLSYHKPTQNGQLKPQTMDLIDSLNTTIQKKYKYLPYEEKQIVTECLRNFKANKQIETKLQVGKLLLPKHAPSD